MKQGVRRWVPLRSLDSRTAHQASAESSDGGATALAGGELDQDALAELVFPVVAIQEELQLAQAQLFEFSLVFH